MLMQDLSQMYGERLDGYLETLTAARKYHKGKGFRGIYFNDAVLQKMSEAGTYDVDGKFVPTSLTRTKGCVEAAFTLLDGIETQMQFTVICICRKAIQKGKKVCFDPNKYIFYLEGEEQADLSYD